MKNEKDLFDEIESVLHTHEDAYVPGAWEEFVRTKKRRRGIIYMRWVAAAAILLFVCYAAWLFKPATKVDDTGSQTNITKNQPYSYPKTKPGNDTAIANNADVPQNSSDKSSAAPVSPLAITQGQAVKQSGAVTKTVEAPGVIVNNTGKTTPTVTNNAFPNINPQQPDANAVANNEPLNNTSAAPGTDNNATSVVVKTDPKRYERGATLNYDSLANLSKPKPTKADEKKSKNLSYAVMVSPSVGNQKMNFGTGVEVAYNINKNFSVSSGINYAYVNAGANRTPSIDATPNRSLAGFSTAMSAPDKTANTFGAQSSQTVQSVKLALSGLEIPLNFQYKTKSGFYMSAGVSAMSVIGNDISYNVLSNRTVSSGSGLNSLSVITEQATTKSSEKLTGYVGFYTFSAGKKMSIGSGKLNFAPFIKVPFTRVSSENIQLIHGGVQLGFGF